MGLIGREEQIKRDRFMTAFDRNRSLKSRNIFSNDLGGFLAVRGKRTIQVIY